MHNTIYPSRKTLLELLLYVLFLTVVQKLERLYIKIIKIKDYFMQVTYTQKNGN